MITLIEKRYIKDDFNYILVKETVKELTKEDYDNKVNLFTFLICRSRNETNKISVVKDGNKITKTEIYSSDKKYKTEREFKFN